MKPFFGYFGGKFNLGAYYPPPVNEVIVEPFAGSAGYSVRYPHHKVILSDLDPVIFSVWNYLIHVKSSEIRRLPLKIDHVESLRFPQEVKWFLGFWMTKASSHPAKSPCSWMRSGEHKTSFWGETIRERIASQVDQIRHWQILNLSFADLPDINATWFVDPPYFKQGYRYRYNSIDYKLLGSWCREQRKQVIVCESEGAAWLPFKSFKDNRGIKKVTHEVVYHRVHP
jgi:site-specific DNA-adenine methylase